MTLTVAKADITEVAPIFFVRDVITSAEFYRDVLGFRFGEFFGDPPGFVIVSRGAARVMLSQSDSAAPQQGRRPPNFSSDAYFYTSDVDALAREFEANGAEFVLKPITRTIYPGRELVVRDCDGRDLMFAQLLDD
jgi:predicted enzyme related to lactoylglutathione lyase